MQPHTRQLDSSQDISDAFQACEELAKSSYENFNVGSRLIKRKLRPHFYSVYAFCRLVDDLGDEVEGDRLEQLDQWETELNLCYDGTPNVIWFRALQQTIREFDIPAEPFLRLIEANRRDQRVTEYQNYDELIEYCTYSATPVGHLVLYLYGYYSERLAELSDHTCIALQLANFWQDVARDDDMGRCYIPQSDMDRFGVNVTDIQTRVANPGYQDLMKFQVDRTRDLFRQGYALHQHLDAGFKLEFSAITAGGLAVLNAIEGQDYDTLRDRPTVSRFQKIGIMTKIYLRSKLGMTPIHPKAFLPPSDR